MCVVCVVRRVCRVCVVCACCRVRSWVAHQGVVLPPQQHSCRHSVWPAGAYQLGQVRGSSSPHRPSMALTHTHHDTHTRARTHARTHAGPSLSSTLATTALLATSTTCRSSSTSPSAATGPVRHTTRLYTNTHTNTHTHTRTHARTHAQEYEDLPPCEQVLCSVRAAGSTAAATTLFRYSLHRWCVQQNKANPPTPRGLCFLVVVQYNPAQFGDAYWIFNSIKVYQYQF